MEKDREIKNNNHYSEQTGHLARGIANRDREAFERRFGVTPPKMPVSIELVHLYRRQMRRVTQSGRK